MGIEIKFRLFCFCLVNMGDEKNYFLISFFKKSIFSF